MQFNAERFFIWGSLRAKMFTGLKCRSKLTIMCIIAYAGVRECVHKCRSHEFMTFGNMFLKWFFCSRFCFNFYRIISLRCHNENLPERFSTGFGQAGGRGCAGEFQKGDWQKFMNQVELEIHLKFLNTS